MEHFGDLVKRARYEELAEDLADVWDKPWSWDLLRALLARLGVDDAYGFLAAGWWLPVDARLNPTLVDQFAGEAERAMAEGDLPEPGNPYSWDDVFRLTTRCNIQPEQIVRNLLWEYALTPGEPLFLDAVRAVISGPGGPGAAAPWGAADSEGAGAGEGQGACSGEGQGAGHGGSKGPGEDPGETAGAGRRPY